MSNAMDSTCHLKGGEENMKFIMTIWSDEYIEEIQEETLWEIFSSEIDNWPALNMQSADL